MRTTKGIQRKAVGEGGGPNIERGGEKVIKKKNLQNVDKLKLKIISYFIIFPRQRKKFWAWETLSKMEAKYLSF